MLPEERSDGKSAKSNSYVDNLKSPRGKRKFSTWARKNSSDLSYDSSEVSFDSSEEFFLSSEEIAISSGTIWEIPRRKSESIGAI